MACDRASPRIEPVSSEATLRQRTAPSRQARSTDECAYRTTSLEERGTIVLFACYRTIVSLWALGLTVARTRASALVEQTHRRYFEQ